MELPKFEGIILKSNQELENEKKQAEARAQEEQEKICAKNFLQFAYAQRLKFLPEDNDLLDAFILKYGEAIGEMIKVHPEIVDSYRRLLQEGKQDKYDFNHFEEILRQYKSHIPTVH